MKRKMIPPSVIDQIRQSADIVDIVADYVKLRQSGKNFKALSPFTSEKTPSFVVSPDKQLYKCFSSGKGGNVFSFIMEMERVPFPEAVELVARRVGIDLSRYQQPEPSPEEETEEGVAATLKWAARLFHATLQQEQGTAARRYLENTRGLTTATIRTFGLGYAPDQWDHLVKQASLDRRDPRQLRQLGLVTPNRNRAGDHDTFRHRVIFPVFSVGGNVLGFGGRTLSNDPQTPKYLNSAESSSFEKSKILYGLHAAKQEIRRRGAALLVEGYMDVIALHQAGITNAVATCGTALTRQQAALLRRFTNRVLFVYDADRAGQQSMMRGIDLLLPEAIEAFVLTLPPGDDPDSYVRREGKEQFEQYSQQAMRSFLDFQIAFHTQSGDFSEAGKKSAAIRAMIHSIALIPDPVHAELNIQELARKLDLSRPMLQQQLEKERASMQRHARRPLPSGYSPTPPVVPASAPSTTAVTGTKPVTPLGITEKTFLKALLESTRYGNAVLEFAAQHAEMLELEHPVARFIFTTLIERYQARLSDTDTTIDIITELATFEMPEARDLASELLMDPPVSEKWNEQGSDTHAGNARRCLAMFLDAFRNIILDPLLLRQGALTEQIRLASDETQQTALLHDKITLDATIKKAATDLKQMIAAILEKNQSDPA